MPTKQTKSTSTITSTHHNDKRVNIPTKELEGFMQEEEQQPKKILYPRDPSLDPQLVWKGKDEQDARALEVPAVPIYIQEKIHPQAIIENVRNQAATEQKVQLSLFSDFNNISWDDLVDFYHHEQNWTNRMILGDSLLVMTSLAEKESLKGRVQMIYIDPPYGIKFGSNWQVSTRKRSVQDGRDEDVTRQPEQIKAFRDTWSLGIHSYLSYIRDRLVVSRELLSESGSVFVQIGDENIHLVRSILDEIFGSENFVSQISVQKTTSAGGGQGDDQAFQNVIDFVIWYAKDKPRMKYRSLFTIKVYGETGALNYSWIRSNDGIKKRIPDEEIERYIDNPEAKLFRHDNLTSSSGVDKTRYEVSFQGRKFSPHPSVWKTGASGMKRLKLADRLFSPSNTLRYIRFMDDFPVNIVSNMWNDMTGGVSDKIYVVQTNVKVITRCLIMTTDPGDLVIDPTCGSGTTAYVAEQWGRRWITIDTSRVSIALARTRLMAARFPYYLLADSIEGLHKIMDMNKQLPPSPMPVMQQDVRLGFVYKSVPHITLKSIANNEEIDVIHAKWQIKLDEHREQINQGLGNLWEEWEVPREAGAKWPELVCKAHAEWWNFRQERQKEIDHAIASSLSNLIIKLVDYSKIYFMFFSKITINQGMKRI